MKRAKIVCTIAFSILLFYSGIAESWEISLDANFTLTQNTYSDNWAGGETGSISWVFNSNFLVAKQIHPKINIKTTLKLAFGQTHSQNRDTKKWEKPQKSTDLIDLESLLSFTLGGFVDPFISGRMETQFFDASDREKDRYINPITFTESFGIKKEFLKTEKDEWSARIGAGFRNHLDKQVLNMVTGKRENITTNDGGLIFVNDFKIVFAQDKLSYTNKLTLFRAVYNSQSEKLKGLPNENYWKAIDVNFENMFMANITKYLMANIYLQFLYDKEIDKKMRIKETLALSLTFKFI